MNLCIDEGNSRTKVAVFDDESIIFSEVVDQLNVAKLSSLIREYDITSGILSSVISTDEELVKFLTEQLHDFIVLDHNTLLPIKNTYRTPATLGKDRLAAIVGANALLPADDVLVIDAGTAITYDFIDSKGVYIGGNIAPGIELRLKALNSFTNKLPLVPVNCEVELLGTDTTSAIQAGVLYGIVFEIDGFIERLMLKYPKLSVFLTGGSAVCFENKLKNCIFANANLVVTGLNRILKYNVKNT
ncbi:type III pantothenate kinase [Paludibacter sp.]